MYLLHVRLLFIAVCSSLVCSASQHGALGTELQNSSSPTATSPLPGDSELSNAISIPTTAPLQQSTSRLPVIVTAPTLSSVKNGPHTKSASTKKDDIIVTITTTIYDVTSVSVFADSYYPASTPSPTNAYQVLSAAQQSFSKAKGWSSTFDTIITSSAAVLSTAAAVSSSAAAHVISGAVFTLDGYSYTAFRLNELNQPTVVIQGSPTTATLNLGQPATLPVDEVVSLDMSGNPIVSGSTVYLSALPSATAVLLTDAISTGHSSSELSDTVKSPSSSSRIGYSETGSRSITLPPSTAVWGNGIPTETSTVTGAASVQWNSNLSLLWWMAIWIAVLACLS